LIAIGGVDVRWIEGNGVRRDNVVKMASIERAVASADENPLPVVAGT
jgi:hypothetical protein